MSEKYKIFIETRDENEKVLSKKEVFSQELKAPTHIKDLGFGLSESMDILKIVQDNLKSMQLNSTKKDQDHKEITKKVPVTKGKKNTKKLALIK